MKVPDINNVRKEGFIVDLEFTAYNACWVGFAGLACSEADILWRLSYEAEDLMPLCLKSRDSKEKLPELAHAQRHTSKSRTHLLSLGIFQYSTQSLDTSAKHTID